MKKFAVLLLTAISITALGQNDWVTMWPRINGVSVGNLCVEGDNLKSIDPIPLCVSHTEKRLACRNGDMSSCRVLMAGERASGSEIEHTEVYCNRYEQEILEFPRLQSVQKCVKQRPINETHSAECLQWETEPHLIPLDYRVEIWKNYGGERGLDYSHSMDYSILECF